MSRCDGVALRQSLLLSLYFVTCCVARPAAAHVIINSPNGGETLTSGTSHTIEWEPAVAPHDTQRFEVFYSLASADGPWTSIAPNVPPGSLAIGSLHTFSWTVPNVADVSAWIRVRQENLADSDYEDVSDASFAIAAAALAGDYNNNQVVDAADYTIWRNSEGREGTGLAADGDHNNRVDAADYAVWKSNFGDTSGAGSKTENEAIVVPEPLAGVLLAVALALSTIGRRSRSSRCETIVG
ncbi:MAG: hypothetical protein AB7G28_11370 [Pirellulales bacterium]